MVVIVRPVVNGGLVQLWPARRPVGAVLGRHAFGVHFVSVRHHHDRRRVRRRRPTRPVTVVHVPGVHVTCKLCFIKHEAIVTLHARVTIQSVVHRRK